MAVLDLANNYTIEVKFCTYNVVSVIINLDANLFYLSLTLSAHAREGYSSHFVCLSVCPSAFLLWRRRHFQGHQYILGDD